MLSILAVFAALGLASAAPVGEAAPSCYAIIETELCGPTCPTCNDYVCECCSTFVIPPPLGPQPSYVCQNGHPPSDDTAEGEDVSCGEYEVVCDAAIQALGDDCLIGTCTACTKTLQDGGVDCATPPEPVPVTLVCTEPEVKKCGSSCPECEDYLCECCPPGILSNYVCDHGSSPTSDDAEDEEDEESCGEYEVVCDANIQAVGVNCIANSCIACTAELQALGVNCATSPALQCIAHGGYPVATDDGGFVCDFPCGNDWTKLCTDPPCPPGATSAVPGAECNTKCLDYISPRCGVGRKPICDSQVDADRFLSLAARCL